MELDKIKPGMSGETEATITKELTTNRTGREGEDVLSTPGMLDLMENASIKVTDHLLPDGYTSVGYAVDGLRHLAPTPLGGKVKIKATVTSVDKNKLGYELEAYEGDKKVGIAIHKRAIISKASVSRG